MTDNVAAMRKKRRAKERPGGVKDHFMSRSETRRGPRDYVLGDDKPVQSAPKQPVILAKPDSNIEDSKRAVLMAASPTSLGNKTRNKQRLYKSDSASSPVHSPGPDAFNARLLSQSSETEHELNKGKAEIYKGNLGKTSKQSATNPPQSEAPGGMFAKDKIDTSKLVKLLDISLNWVDTGLDLMEDQSDFLVVGVLGLQGVGKSTIMSCLAGSDVISRNKKLIFPCQSTDVMEHASNITVGVDMHVSEERIILLDAQPILSPAMLEQCINNDRKMSSEYNGPSVGIEVQSLQLATYFFSVCHVVILVQDWFTDFNLYKFLHAAEMLKLSTPAPSGDLTSMENEFKEFCPHLIFVQNKAESHLFDPSNVIAMTEMISSIMKHSKLLYKGSISLSRSMLLPNLSACLTRSSEINLFMIPHFKQDTKKTDTNQTNNKEFSQHPRFINHPNDETILKTFRNMIFSIRRLQLTRQGLTEKNWFYYAAKTWDAIKKSQMMSEYNRLLV